MLTLVGNLEAFIELARWIKFIFRNWAEIITLFWRTIIPWRIDILAEDAVVLTLLTILFFNLLITSRHKDVAVRQRGWDFVLLLSGILAVGYLGFIGFAEKYDDAQLGLVNSAMGPLRQFLEDAGAQQFVQSISFVAVLAAGAAAMAVAYTPFALTMGLRPNVNAYAIRLWRILFGVGIAVVINQASLALESEDWQRLFRTAALMLTGSG